MAPQGARGGSGHETKYRVLKEGRSKKDQLKGV